MELALIPQFLYHRVRLDRQLRWRPDQIREHQAQRLRELRRFVLERVPYYREAHRGLEAAPLAALPVVTRSELLGRFDEMVSDPRIRLADIRRHMETAAPGTPYLGRYRVSTSTGSTGGQVSIIVVSRGEWAYHLAAAARTRDLAGKPLTLRERPRTAIIVSGQRWFATAKLADSVRSSFAPQRFLDANAPVATLVSELNAYRPDVLSGYTSVIGMLAEEQLAGRLAIMPGMVTTGGEVTVPEVRKRIAAAWGHEPFDYYGASETGSLAAECLEGRRMHLYEDTTIIEVVDEDNRPVPDGTWGAKVLATPLWLRTQPLIRIEIADVVRVSPDPCPCGRASRVLDGIRGRRPRIFELPAANGRGTVSLSWMGLATGLVELPATYRSFDVEGDVFVVRLAGLPPGYDLEPLRPRIAAEFEAHGAVPPRIEFRVLTDIPRAPSGKAIVAAAPPNSTPANGRDAAG